MPTGKNEEDNAFVAHEAVPKVLPVCGPTKTLALTKLLALILLAVKLVIV